MVLWSSVKKTIVLKKKKKILSLEYVKLEVLCLSEFLKSYKSQTFLFFNDIKMNLLNCYLVKGVVTFFFCAAR